MEFDPGWFCFIPLKLGYGWFIGIPLLGYELFPNTLVNPYDLQPTDVLNTAHLIFYGPMYIVLLGLI